MTSQSIRTRRRNTILASLSATAAALTASGAEESEAQVITVSVNKTLGYGNGDLSNFSVSLPGATMNFITRNGNGPNVRILSAVQGAGSVLLRGTSGNGGGALYLRKANAGQVFHSIGASSSRAGLIGLAYQAGGGINLTTGNPAYYAFKFKNTTTNQTNYGYMNTSFTNTAFNSFDITINSLVYNNTGVEIPIPSVSAVPEPSALALGAFASMVVGAPAVRRWLKNRKAGSGSGSGDAA